MAVVEGVIVPMTGSFVEVSILSCIAEVDLVSTPMPKLFVPLTTTGAILTLEDTGAVAAPVALPRPAGLMEVGACVALKRPAH
jgi:hypothetical protein